MPDRSAVEAALEGLREGYKADGYELLVDDVSEGRVTVRIEAGPEACEECLVAKPIAREIFLASLRDLPDVRDIELIYPID
jgi:hypothetical protein